MANDMYKKMDIGRHGPRLMPNNCQIFDPPYFSLPTTFKKNFEEMVDILRKNLRGFLYSVIILAKFVRKVCGMLWNLAFSRKQNK